MNDSTWIKQHGTQEQTVDENWAADTAAQNYSLEDAFIEMVDNPIDERRSDVPLEVTFTTNAENHTLVVEDNASGVADEKDLFKVGGSRKKNKRTIGKYGIGLKGATARIAMDCISDEHEVVQIKVESARKGKSFVKYVAYSPDGKFRMGNDTQFAPCDESLHYTRFTFTNVDVKNVEKIIKAFNKTFEVSFQWDVVNIIFNGKQVKDTCKYTFTDSETKHNVKVGAHEVYVIRRIDPDDTTTQGAGLRIYDKNTGRLLDKSITHWRCFANKEVHTSINGLHCAIFIDGTKECYRDFGVKVEKNGIAQRQYYKDPKFKELYDKLKEFISQIESIKKATRKEKQNVCEYSVNGKEAVINPKLKAGLVYYYNDNDDTYYVNSKINGADIIPYIDELEKLREENACLRAKYNIDAA